MTILISLVALLQASCRAGEEIYVRTDRSVPVERLARAVVPMGRIESRERGTSVYLVQLRDGVDDDRAKEILGRIPGVSPLEPKDEPMDLTSVSSLGRKILHLTRDEDQDRDREAKSNKVEHERDEVDYLKSYQAFVTQRAFPNDTVDWSAYHRAREHVAAMPAAKLRRAGEVSPATSPPMWNFLGPTNMTVPYQQYYGQSPVSGRVNAVAFDPNNSQTMYAAGAEGGLWKSTNGGANWTWLSSSWSELGVNCVVIDPNDSSTIYVGRGDYHGYIAGSYGLMKSTDGGNTWTEIAEATMGLVGVDCILLDPTNTQTVIAGTGDINTFGHLYRSTNGGQTWTQVAVGGNDFEWPTLASSVPGTGNLRFYSIASGYAESTHAASRVYKSDDHGQTWQLLPSTIAVNGKFHYAYCVTTSQTQPGNVYALDSENRVLLTSTNQGATWTNESANLPLGPSGYNFSQDFYDYYVKCGSVTSSGTTSDVLFLGEIDILESFNGGASWTSIGGPTYELNGAVTHNDQHCLTQCPTNPNFYLFGNDGGVYSLSYNPQTGTNSVVTLNQTISVTTFYKIACHPTNPSIVLGGTQDQASPVSSGDLSNWFSTGGGDGGGSAINQAIPLVQYTTSEDFVFYQTTNGWSTGSRISPTTVGGEHLPFTPEVVLDPSNQSLMYSGTNYLYQFNAETFTWTERLAGKDLTNDTKNLEPTIAAIAVAPTDSRRIYTGSSDGALWMTTDQGTTWIKLSGTASLLPNQAITTISVSPVNENDILVGMSGNGSGKAHLCRCTNTMVQTPTFAGVSGSGTTGLPDISLNEVVRDLDNPASTWWVAMDSGVFQTTDSGATWSNAGSTFGLPGVIVEDLAAVMGTRTLNAGTYGRGFWNLYLPVSLPVASLVNLTVSPAAVISGQQTTGTVTLSSPAPSGGITVMLRSSSSTVGVPSSVAVSAGSMSGTFQVQVAPSAPDGIDVVTASYGGASFPAALSVTPLALEGVSVNPGSVVAGSPAVGTVTLNGPAGAASKVTLKSSSAAAVVPVSVTVPAGSSSARFSIATANVSTATSATITAEVGKVSKTGVLKVTPNTIQALALSSSSVIGGSNVIVSGMVTLAGPAPAAGVTVELSSSKTTAATVPASVKVVGGSSSASFEVTHLAVSAVTAATLKATTGKASQSAILTVDPVQINAVILSSSSVVGGTDLTGTVQLSATAGSKGFVVKLKSSSPDVVVPASVKVPPGATSVTFGITTKQVKAGVNAVVTATAGAGSVTAGLAVGP